MNLSEQQKLFCEEYLIDLNGTQAAIRANYSKRTASAAASRLLRNVKIQEYIKKRMAEKEDALIAKQDEVLKHLTAVMRREKLEAVVVTCKKHKAYYDDNGKKVIDDCEEPMIVDVPAKISDTNKAAELLGKYYTLFTDKTQIESEGVVQIINDIPRGKKNDKID